MDRNKYISKPTASSNSKRMLHICLCIYSEYSALRYRWVNSYLKPRNILFGCIHSIYRTQYNLILSNYLHISEKKHVYLNILLISSTESTTTVLYRHELIKKCFYILVMTTATVTALLNYTEEK